MKKGPEKRTVKHSQKKRAKHKPSKESKGLSTDAKGAIALIVLAAILTAIVGLTEREPVPQTEKGESEAEDITSHVQNKLFSDEGLMEHGELSYARLSAMTGMAYDVLKRDLGVDGEIVIYLEDEDGNPIPLNDEGEVCIGDPTASVGGIPCSK